MEGCNGHNSSGSRSLERAISRKAMQAGSSAPCKTWLIGFFCGVCITCLFGVVALPPLRVIQSQSVYPLPLRRAILSNFTFTQPADGAAAATDELPSAPEKMEQQKENENITEDARIMYLYNEWSTLLSTGRDEVTKSSDGISNKDSDLPRPPHLEDCRTNAERNKLFDSYGDNGTFPPWTLWKGSLGLEFLSHKYSEHADQHTLYPPWIVGSDEENYPLTRQVQRDIWTHQHPRNCSDPGLRFLVADWERLPGFGIGAQIAGMSGLLAIAMKEKRILVTNHYNRADHDGCKGASRSSWSCYFFPETSPDCRNRAFELVQSKASWADGTVKVKENYTSKQIWLGRIPRVWGKPWKYLQPTTVINGKLITNHRKMNRRWWVAQATRYLMRFPTEYMCGLLNVARHSAFGLQAAKLVLQSIQDDSPKVGTTRTKSDIERLVWSDHKPYLPQPLLSMHIRMGDKACEMVVVGFEEYMELAGNLRKRFPSLKNIWLSTEMQEVIDKTKLYPHWSFHFTSVARQGSNMTMAMYEASLGRETSTNYPLVNFMMATEADFFIGALGSTWCYLIDGMRNTGGKVMSGYLSVNKDRFW
ncbi:hypothetical protein BDA96_04G363800 [Sorghum bicolor]|uniref:Alpha-(1,6)-fucosyltransferase n=2 Tax=Sorghum bicolor TaxID=4558 RepID=A0A921UN24_SORBI|nr:uncharacterized protein LOC8084689 [Sorghum bicolor]EES07728.2 hypothetical protein SORBI_3004G339900 [Sorghum bicolor]KAG0535406.1 hypothetical protein BDA96_04G363800 [Sorghum bicolor]|eukprot:XP_021314280.1 uncharacterized protein LOC8084689 [Sorghum bicolor]